ncbi:MAG: hypothetical protein AAF798_22700 [Bacteroidota bacterium]
MTTYQLIPLALLILNALIIVPYSNPGSIEGRWSAVDEYGNTIVIEFTADKAYNLFVNGENLTADVSQFGQIQYEVHWNEQNVMIDLYGANDQKEFAQLQAETQSDQLKLIALTPQGQAQNSGHILLERMP